MRAPQLPKIDPWETGLRLTGLALATSSIGFAAHMMSDDKAEPRINGIEHLAIYARPATHVASRQRATPGVDYMPVGSTAKSDPRRAPTNYEILEASRDWALVRLPQGRIMRVTPGGGVPGLGGVIAIERRGDKWALVTEAGVIPAAR
jgi:hypothetical protein